MELHSSNDGAPLLELIDPVVQRRLGYNDHVRAMDTSVFMQIAQQRDGLQRLSQALHAHRKLNTLLLLPSIKPRVSAWM